MPDHTPGPWAIGDWHEAPVVAMPLLFNARSDTVVVAPREPLPEEVAANLRLIAAAPELLAACEAALEYAPHGEMCNAGECHCWQRFMRAAVSKAKGG